MSFFKSIWGDYFFSVMVLMVCLGISVGIAWQYQKNWNDRTHAEFADAAADRIAMVRAQVAHGSEILNSIASLYYASEDVSASEFHIFNEQLLTGAPFVRGVSWVPAVPDAERSTWEKRARAWDPDFMISETDAAGQLTPAAKRPVYFPLYYTEPQRDGKYLGFDYASEHSRMELLERSRKMRQMSVSEKVTLLRYGETGVIFSQPIFKSFGESEKFLGYIVSTIALTDLVAAALLPLNKEGVNIIISDVSALREEDRLLHAHSTRLKDIPETEIIEDFKARSRLSESAIVNVGGRQWDITVQSARGYFEPDIPRETYMIIAAGVVFSTLLFFFMFSRISENERIGRKVSDRTGELQLAKNQIETILFSTKDGIIGMDREEKITFCNPMAASLLGYFKRDIMGASFRQLIAPSTESGEKSEETETVIKKVLETGDATTVSDQLFWKRDGTSLQTEYTVSPILGNNDVEGAVLTFRDISERRRMEKKLEQMARFDQLTGLANRAAFVDQLKMALGRAKRTGKMVGVVYIDLNNFKPINDTLGHAAGDMMLKGFADRLKKSAREYDLPARVGGDEFTVMVDNLDDKDGAIRLVERLIENLAAPFKIYDKAYQMSGSIGLAFYPIDAETYDDLITHADSAMYVAKKNKGNPDALPYAIYEKPA